MSLVCATRQLTKAIEAPEAANFSLLDLATPRYTATDALHIFPSRADMSSPEDEKDEETRFRDDGPTTPFGTPKPSQQASELHLSERATRDIAQRFDLLGELGRGGMGIVYRARDRETSEIVALKILKPEIADRPDLIERFKTELRLARKITHKNVCRSYDLHRFGETVVIAMEYVEGESLRAVLSRPGGVSLRGGMKWASQICAALAEAHAQGIVHRDLKPENIVIDSSGQAKVMDFGIARSIDTTTTTGVITGTAAYMSPEQAEGKPADARSDIYSLGMIFYEMFTGQQGLKAESPIALVHKQIHETPTPPREVEPHLPPFLERVIQRCLEKNPKQRFQSVAELDAALTETPEAKAPTAEGAEISLPPHLAYWQRSDWTLLVGAVAAAALFLVLFYRYHPASVMEVKVNEEQQKQIIVETLKKLNLDLEPSDAHLAVEGFDYYGMASEVGIRRAHQFLANERVAPSWNGDLASHSQTSGGYSIDGGGRPLSLTSWNDSANSQATPPPDAAALAEMKDVARKGLSSFFGVDVSTKEPYKIIPSTSQNLAVFLWRLPMKSGNLVDFRAMVAGSKIRELNRGARFPYSDVWEPYFLPGRSVIAPLVMIVFSLTVFFWRKVYRQERSFQNLAVALLVGSCSVAIMAATVTATEPPHGKISDPEEARLAFIFHALSFCLWTLLSYATLNVVLHYLRKRLPTQVSNYVALGRNGLPVRAAGLELLRGIFAAMIFCCAWMALMALGGLWGKALVGMISFAGPFQSTLANLRSTVGNIGHWFIGGDIDLQSPALTGGLIRYYVPFLLAEGLLVPWLFVALPLSLLAKLSARVPVLIAALAGLWLGLGFSLAGAMAYPSVAYYIIVALQAAFFGVVFLKYGLLATSSAVLTVETVLLAFPLFTIFRNLHPLLLSVPAVVWLLMFLGAGAIYLQPQLATAYRRVTAVFE